MIGDPEGPVAIDDLLTRRAWSRRALVAQIRRLRRLGEIDARGAGWILTPRGRDAARRVVRTHRLWEFYLTTHADIAPNHVDHCADSIEHVLGPQLVDRLERALRRAGALAEGETVPRSPHDLAGGETAA